MAEKALTHGLQHDKVVERQMRNWELARAQHHDPTMAAIDQVADFITIANDVGGGGGEIGTLLGERLGWPVFDRQLVTAMAGDDDLRARLYRNMDERDLGWLEEMFRSIMQEEFRKNDYFHRLTETIFCLARRGSAVFVGRAVDLVLPHSKGLRVKVLVSLESRIRRFAETTGMDEKHAAREVDRIARSRTDFIRQHFHRDINDPARFDLLINIERFSDEQAVGLILGALRLRGIAIG